MADVNLTSGRVKVARVFQTPAVLSGLQSLADNSMVLVAAQGQGGNPHWPHADNGLWIVHGGAWDRVVWSETSVPRPHIEVGDPTLSPVGDATHGTWTLAKRGSGVVAYRI